MNFPAAILAVAALTALSGRPAAAQQHEYPDPFPGGYPSLAGVSNAGRMYMESYFPPPVTASPTYPAWSPDGDSIAFAYQGRIWVVPAGGGTARQVTSGAGYHSQPSWSPDGSQIAYAADIDRNFDIFVAELATGGSRRLTTHPFLDLRPRWSPDGSRILFTTERDGTFDLWVHDLGTGAAEAVIANPDANDMAGDWISDTGDIVFVSRRGEAALGSGSLWRYRAATGAVELLIRIETNYQAAPVVARHGGIVAYVTDASGNNDLYAVPSEKSPRGIQPVRLTHTRTDEYFPSWSPDGERLVLREERRRRGPAPHDRPRDGVRALHGHPRRRRAATSAHRRLRLVRAHRPAARPRQRPGRRTPAVAHLPDRRRRARVLPGRQLPPRRQRDRGLLLPHRRQLLRDPARRRGHRRGLAGVRNRARFTHRRGPRRGARHRRTPARPLDRHGGGRLVLR